MRDVLVIGDLETLKAIAEPTRVAVLELLSEPRSVTQLAEALGVPRTRLYHHVDLLRERGLIEVVEERRVGAMTEQIYAPTAKTFRPDPALLSEGEREERVAAMTTLFFDATKSDVRRLLLSADDAEPRPLELGRSIAHLTPAQAEALAAELRALVARFDEQHQPGADARPFAFSWALYPAARALG